MPRETQRGTTNTNARGSSENRRVRREWLVVTFRANCDIPADGMTDPDLWGGVAPGQGIPACRCYRCGILLTATTLTVDRIIPGIEGGTYRRNNIRPACGTCNSLTGAKLAHSRKVA